MPRKPLAVAVPVSIPPAPVIARLIVSLKFARQYRSPPSADSTLISFSGQRCRCTGGGDRHDEIARLADDAGDLTELDGVLTFRSRIDLLRATGLAAQHELAK